MPDFERIVDDLRLELAETPEQKQYVLGFIDGKAKARKEMVLCALVGSIIVVTLAVAGAI